MIMLIFIFAILVIPAQSSFAATSFPIEATTADGKIVVLHEDGTWRPKTLQLDHSVIRKSDFATRVLKSRLKFYEFSVDPKIWKDHQATGAFEYDFEHTDGEAWCGIIPERIQVTQDALVKVAVANLQKTDQSGKLEQRSKAYVNGLGGEVVELSARVEGFFLSYYTFLWSGSKGTVQITCWTSSNVVEEYKPIFNDFFGGFLLAE